MQTAVEWLEKELMKIPFVNPKEVFEQAKKMEKKQIIDAYKEGFNVRNTYKNFSSAITAKTPSEYYTSTYGSKGSDEIKTK